jgi:hypothetical protein
MKGKKCFRISQLRWEDDAKRVLKEIDCGLDSCGYDRSVIVTTILDLWFL